MRVAFFIHKFPQTSEVFIIRQVADLLRRGVDVCIYRFEKGDATYVSHEYTHLDLEARTRTIGVPIGLFSRITGVLWRSLFLLTTHPALLFDSFSSARFGSRARSFQMLFSTYALAGESFDIVHCHFGKTANQYLPIRRLMGHTMPMLTSFYGYDVSMIPKQKELNYYDGLKKECHSYIVMSQDMKTRVVELGFPEHELQILPVSIDVEEIPFTERTYEEGRPVEIVSVGRFVEKKGFDDLLRALAIVKEKATKPFRATIIGGGVLEGSLKALAKELHVEEVVSFPGFMKVQDVIRTYLQKHLYVQPSKTAPSGDME